MGRTALIAVLCSFAASYEASVLEWRKAHEAELRGEDGYLTVAGLFWLKEGVNTVGADENNDVILPEGLPKRAGNVEFVHKTATFRHENGTSRILKPDTAGGPDIVRIGRVRMYLIERGGRYGLRIKDPDSQLRRNFKGIQWFPVRPEYRIEAEFVPYNPPKTLLIASIVGTSTRMSCPGVARFRLSGQLVTLEPVTEGNRLFYIFRDRTSGRQTYGAGRFLYTPLPTKGKVILDFNRAENPPCAYNPFTTCPLPPKQNHLPVPVEAGERAYPGTGH